MAEYEVMRELFNGCSGKWELDDSFTREIETDDIEKELASWFHGKLPGHQVDTRPDGTIVYTFDPPARERYFFSAF